VTRISSVRLRELLKKELRQMFRDPRMRGIIFVAPVFQLIAFGYAVNTDIRNTATYVVDLDASASSRELLDRLTSTQYFRVVGRSDRPSDMVRALDNNSAVLGIQIPPRFERELASGTATVQIVLDGSSSNTATVAQGYAGQVVQRYALEYAAGLGLLPEGGIDLRTRAWYNPELESRVYNVPAVIGALVMLMCLLLTSLAVVREREVGTLDQLLVSPLTAPELIIGKTIPVVLVGLIQVTLISTLAILWFDVPMRGSVPALALAALVYILAGVSFGLIISTYSKTQQEAFMSFFLLFMPLMILSGFFFPVSSMPRFFQWITIANPIRHFLEIVRAIFLKGEGIVGLWRQYVLLAVIAGTALTIAMARLRKTSVA
jgi:ABC-2 type transport system permease protein